ncbi:MAG: ATPase [Candidatus Melainabacteria bacterium HGW-Melainabacteria-1]|nr:MAG: ATPase [Candidatus Melainabacteria bacterium HGW-Melainabacteria-1]
MKSLIWLLAEPGTTPCPKPHIDAEVAVCQGCGVVYQHGHYIWSRPAPPGAAAILCPACWQLRDRHPGGLLYLSGGFVTAHAHEILRLIETTSAEILVRQPLERIMVLRHLEDQIEIETTSEALASRLGEAMQQTFAGKLRRQYHTDEQLPYIYWRRK